MLSYWIEGYRWLKYTYIMAMFLEEPVNILKFQSTTPKENLSPN